MRKPSLYSAQYLSLRLASVETIKLFSLIVAAIASNEQTPTHLISAANAKLCAKEIPTLRPVNGPGPMPTATRSMSLLTSKACATNLGKTSP